MYQSGTTASSDSSLDLLAKIVQLATSQHVDTANPAATGSGYAVGDMLEYTTGTGATLFTATFEVVAINGSNQPTALRIVNGGAFSDRVATAAINTAGSGYPASSTAYVRLTGDDATEQGTATQQCKLSVTVNGSGVPTAVSIIEGGGAYTVAPSPLTGVKTATIGPDGVTGSGLTVDITMVSLPSLTGVSLTTLTGSGTGATATLTLAATGQSCNEDDVVSGSLTKGRDRHDFSDAFGKDDHKEVVLTGTVAGGDEPITGYRTYNDEVGATTYTGIMLCAMDTHNPALELTANLNFGPIASGPSNNGGSYLPLANEAAPFWLSVTGRRVGPLIVKTQRALTTSYVHAYDGLLAPIGPVTEKPLPMYVAGSCASTENNPDDGGPLVSGLTEAFRSTALSSGPCYYRRVSDASYQTCANGQGTVMGALTILQQRTIYPIGRVLNVTSGDNFIVNDGNFTFYDGTMAADGGPASQVFVPTVGASGEKVQLIRAQLNLAVAVEGAEDEPYGELENVYWVPKRAPGGGDVAAEDTITNGLAGAAKRVWRVFPNADRSDEYSFMAIEEGV